MTFPSVDACATLFSVNQCLFPVVPTAPACSSVRGLAAPTSNLVPRKDVTPLGRLTKLGESSQNNLAGNDPLFLK